MNGVFVRGFGHQRVGVREGMHAFGRADVERSASVRRAASQDHAARVLPVIEEIGRDLPLRVIAAGLNARGVATPRGIGEWKAGTVHRLLRTAA